MKNHPSLTEVGLVSIFFKPSRKQSKNFRIEPDRTDLLFSKSQTESSRTEIFSNRTEPNR